MNKPFLTVLLILTVILSSCSILKKSSRDNHDVQALNGEWTLIYITGPRIAFDGLFPEKKPTIIIEGSRIGGNNSCNAYGGDAIIKKDSIKIDKPFSTMMACPGNGESTYMEMLKKIRTYKVNGDTLGFYLDDVEMMRFKKKS